MPENTPPVRDRIIGSETPASATWALTSTLTDTNGLHPLSAIASNPNPISPAGFVANGFDSRLGGDTPAWMQSASDRLSMFAMAKCPQTYSNNSSRRIAVSVGHASLDQTKIELATVRHTTFTSLAMFALRVFNGSAIQTLTLNPCGWRFEFRYPELQPPPFHATIPRAQALCFLDSNTLLISAYGSATVNVLYRVDLITGEYTGRASSSVYQHINSLHKDSNGDVWCVCRVGGFDKRKKLDLTTSFATGAITESGEWNTGDVPTSSISFATVGGTNYVLLSQYVLSGSTPKCYVFLESQMSGPVNQVDRVKRFNIGNAVQDLCQRQSDGRLYLSRSNNSIGNSGTIQGYDLAAILAGPDDSTPVALTTYNAPTAFSEGIEFRPSDDRVWVCTEGMQSVGDEARWSSVWSSSMTGMEENSYLVDYADGEFQIRMNERLFMKYDLMTATIPMKLSIGAYYAASAGMSGFLPGGGVRAVSFSRTPFSQTELDALKVL